MALRSPRTPAEGDVWWCKRLGIVRVFNGHKRGTKRGQWPNSFSIYHWAAPSIYSHPCDWRNDDNNAGAFDPHSPREERWKYLGNLFEMLPYEMLTGSATAEDAL